VVFLTTKSLRDKNDTDKRWAFYKDAGYSGDRFSLEPGQSLSTDQPKLKLIYRGSTFELNKIAVGVLVKD
jgi:hypothetical protein